MRDCNCENSKPWEAMLGPVVINPTGIFPLYLVRYVVQVRYSHDLINELGDGRLLDKGGNFAQSICIDTAQ